MHIIRHWKSKPQTSGARGVKVVQAGSMMVGGRRAVGELGIAIGGEY